MENPNYNVNYAPVADSSASEVSRSFLLNVYNWMTMGLAITGIVAYGVSRVLTPELLSQYIILFYGLLIFQLVLVIGLSWVINKIPAVLAIGAFFFYAFVSGLTLSVLFLAYTSASIYSTFFICAAMFASVSVLGYITKIDLSRFGSFLFMALIGLIIASVVNIFLANGTLYWIISYAGVLIFVGLTAYDTQKLKRMSVGMDSKSEEGKKAAVFGALTLYLDFINMFIFLLRILGNRR